VLGYYDNYLIDTTSRVILSVHATPARFSQETVAARRMLEHVGQFGIHPQNLAADKAYGSGEFLAWLLARDIQPHIPVIDRQHQTRGLFTRDAFRYEPKENAYYCPEGKPLHYRGQRRSSGAIFIARKKRNVEAVHKRSHVPQAPIGDCFFTGRSQRDKQFERWQVRLTTSVPNERATRSKLCSPS
jgi:hypothetical protein